MTGGAFGDEKISKRLDPTKPPSVIVQQLAPELISNGNFRLSAIFKRNSTLYAVVNGEVVKAGDGIDGMTITKISDKQVRLVDSQGNVDDVILSIYKDDQVNKQASK